MNVCCITGHRPERIPNNSLVCDELANAFLTLNVDHVIQGMAAGVDLMAAGVAIALNIPFSCAVPWEGHSSVKGWEGDYRSALEEAEHVWIVNDCEGYPGPQVYQERNEFMVDRAHLVIAVWDGVKKGGTWNCVRYAVKMNIPVWLIDPSGETPSGWYAV